ncbi:MAG: PP2C family protein-serine/threonine phosphatase, partial [Solirubrobacteraceae bacterium]
LNGAMLAQDLGGRFITLAYMRLTLENGDARVSVACAGHPPPIVVPSVGEPRPVPAHGPLLGVWPDVEFEAADVVLEHGDAVLVYTDGVSDPGPGAERFPAEALREHPHGADAEQLAAVLEDYARQPAGPQRDDIAIVAVRFLDPRRAGRTGGNGSGSRQLARSAPTLP